VIPREQSRVDQIAPQHRDVVGYGQQQRVHLELRILAARRESRGDVSENCVAVLRPPRHRLEAIATEEPREVGRTWELLAPADVAGNSLHARQYRGATTYDAGVEPPSITLVEVAPRDGLQAEARTLPTETKLALIERLVDAGHKVIEATSFVSPKAVPQLADAEDLLRALKRRPGVRYPVLVPNEKGLERAMSVGVDEIAVFASASDAYSRKNLNRSRDEALAGYVPLVRAAKDGGLRVRGYLSMVIADPWDGPTPRETVRDACRRLLDIGCDELSLGDTSGVGVRYQVVALLDLLTPEIPVAKIAMHFHDTYGQALANAHAAMSRGVRTLDTSTGGIGGSPFAKMAGGNLATEDLLWLCRGSNIETGVDLDAIVATAKWLAAELGHELPAHVSRALAHHVE
jgi:hydroxymethylglutaryl-CoA lyase